MSAPAALHARGAIGCAQPDDFPYVTVGDGIELKVLRVVEAQGVWVVQNRFAPGSSIETHRHTGDVHAWTLAGSWQYAEYGIDYPTGTYVYEPANSIHTLRATPGIQEPTEVVFVMRGANLILADDGQTVTRVDDGPAALAAYRAICEAQGLGQPPVLLE